MNRLWIAFCMSIFLAGCAGTSEKPRQNLNIESSSTVTQRLLAQHNEWQGTPYKLGGNNKGGIDCSGFTQITFAQRFNRSLPRTTAHQVSQGTAVSKHSLKPGDLVFFKTGGNKQRHVGIYLEDDIFLHASTSRGVMLSKLSNPYWAKHYWTARRVPLE